MLKQIKKKKSKEENIRIHSPLKAMFLILKHTDKENNKYPANVDYTDLPKHKKYIPT